MELAVENVIPRIRKILQLFKRVLLHKQVYLSTIQKSWQECKFNCFCTSNQDASHLHSTPDLIHYIQILV